MDVSIKIHNEDCLEGMKKIPDASIDCIICDLPYGTLNRKNKGALWDSPLPLPELWKQYKRIIKKNGAIILFGQGMFTAELMMSNKSMWRYNLVWDKQRTTGFLNANRMPLRQHEDILVFYKKLPAYHPQMRECSDKEKSHHRGSCKGEIQNNCYGNFRSQASTITNYKFPKSIISIAKEHNADIIHPTQKPVELIQYLIRTYTNVGDTILDSCAGSGTCAIACIRTGRSFVGYEKDKKFYDKAVERIEGERQLLENSKAHWPSIYNGIKEELSII